MASDLEKLIDHAQRVDDHAIGFLPRQAIVEYIDAKRVESIDCNGDRVGFALWRISPFRECKIVQCWVRSDARLIENGRRLLQAVEGNAAKRRASCLRCWVADDLPSNLFWQSLGFELVGWRIGRNKTGRRHNLYRRPIQIPQATTTSRAHARP